MNTGSSADFMCKVLAADYACAASLFTQNATVITEAGNMPGRRTYPFRKNELAMVTTGNGVVIRCCRNYREWVEVNLGQLGRDELFKHSILARIDAYLKNHGQSLYGPVLGFVCEPEDITIPATPAGIQISIIGREEMEALSGLHEFSNAVSFRYDTERPNRMAAMAKQGDTIIGMAGSCLDCEGLQQVGVNVLPRFRGTGIGKLVVAVLTRAILENGDVPYYTTWAVNIASRGLAIGVGYRPVYVEAFAGDAADPEGG